MKSYPTYDALAIDLDLHFFNKISILGQTGQMLNDDNWFVVTDDGRCHLFDEKGNLDNIHKMRILAEYFIRKDIKKIIIPDSIIRIAGWAFSNCKNLTNISIPNSVVHIEDYAFSGCISLTNIMIPDSVTSIGDFAFRYCDGLKSVTIPDSVTRIGWYTFDVCKNLKSLFFKGKMLKQVKNMNYYPWGIENEDTIKAEFE